MKGTAGPLGRCPVHAKNGRDGGGRVKPCLTRPPANFEVRIVALLILLVAVIVAALLFVLATAHEDGAHRERRVERDLDLKRRGWHP
jgi:hypothetical protein